MSVKFDIGVSGSSSIDAFFSSPRNTSVRTSGLTRIRVASNTSIPGFVRISNDALIRVSQQDFWKLGEDDDGYYIERLVDDDNGPVSDIV